MIHQFIYDAEYLIQSAEQNIRARKPLNSNASSKWRCIYNQLRNAGLEEHNGSGDHATTLKRRRLLPTNLKSLCSGNKKLNCLVLNLFPLEDGYSLMTKCAGKCHESVQLPYDEYEILDYIDNEQIPPMLLESLENSDINFFYYGCVIVEVRDYRIASNHNSFETSFTLLQPTQQTLLDDVNAIANDPAHNWGHEEKLALESYLVLGTSEPLCLDPSPAVGIIKNTMQRQKNMLQSVPIKRCIRQNGPLGLKRRKMQSLFNAPQSLKLFDFVKKIRSNKKSSSDLKLPLNVTDLWRKSPLNLPYPTNPIDVENRAKALNPRPSSIHDSDMLEVQQVLLRSDATNRDVFSQITIYQRPSDMHYFGRLQSNKYFHSENSHEISNSCTFSLDTERRANLYILQYQELFSEDGRRPAVVTVSRPPQQGNTKYEIPLQQQPWQLEQDKSLYAVSSVNRIATEHWSRLRVDANPPNTRPPPFLSNQQGLVVQQRHPQPSPCTHPMTPNFNSIQQHNQQSAFVLPLARQQQQQQLVGGKQMLQRIASGEKLNSWSGGHQDEVMGSGRMRQGSVQDEVIFVQQTPGNNTSGVIMSRSSTPVTPGGQLRTPTPHEDNTLFHSLDSVALNRSSGSAVSVQLPLQMTQAPQQQHLVKLRSPAQLNNNSHQQQCVIRMPVATNQSLSANTINLLTGGEKTQGASQLERVLQSQSGQRQLSSSGFVMQLAGSSQQDSSHMVGGHVHTVSMATANIMSSTANTPITIISDDSTTSGGYHSNLMQSNGGHRQQGAKMLHVNSSQQQRGAQTITFQQVQQQQQQGQVFATNVQQPVQLVQVSGNTTFQQFPLRIPGQQLLLRSASGGDGNGQQMTLTQHLQHQQQQPQITLAAASNSTFVGTKRAKKRKPTRD